jgi:hypothetical protein
MEKPKRVYRKKTVTKTPLKRGPKPKDPVSNTDLIFAELDKWFDRFPQALSILQAEAGGITSEDVMYHLDLVRRILRNKYTK